MLARLGNVLYWTACLAAMGWAALLVAIFMIDRPQGPGWAIGAIAGSLTIWTIGRACRYVLAGR